MNPTFTDIMLDIETFGTGTNAAIVQIGAVAFNADGENSTLFDNTPNVLRNIGQGFRVNIDLTNSRHPGVIDAGAVRFWLQQSEEARESILQPGVPLGEALLAFAGWIESVGNGRNNVRLWSNGPTFDERIVREAFDRHGFDLPVSFRGSRCCRTMIELAELYGYNRRESWREAWQAEGMVNHDGLADAVAQARGVIAQRLAVRLGNGTATSAGPGEIT